MDVYMLNSNYEPVEVIENFISLIWTERFRPAGEFQLVIEKGSSLASQLVEDTLLGVSESKEVMYIETVTVEENITLSGYSTKKWLDRRVSDTAFGPLGESDEIWEGWNPGDIVVSSIDQFQYVAGDPETLPINTFVNNVVNPVVDAEYMPPGSVYDWVQTFCEAYNMGYTMYPTSVGTPYLTFRIYTGMDRTSTSSNTLVAFSEDLDNLANTKLLRSNAQYKNVAYVCGSRGTLLVGVDGTVNPTISGTARRVLAVDATDIKTAPGSTLTKKLKARGIKALSDYKKANAFDGEIPEGTPLKLGTDFFLGDFVELWDYAGNKSKSRVTEWIRSVDSSGVRSYPTLEYVA